MSEYICFLITLLYEEQSTLMKCALKVRRDFIDDVAEYPMEEASREFLHGLLPEHVRSVGPIVDVEEIFEVHHV